MGCFQSKKDSGDIHPNVFRVVNVDEDGAALWSGQLEITETELILYRAGRDATNWPLASLRRYGFEGEIFSFESGRRCATGEGIYAFRCRRAAILFHVLQSNIQLRNVIQESLPFQLPSTLLTGSPPALPRQTLQASVVHRSSIDNGQPSRPATTTNHNQGNHMHLQTGPSHSTAQTPRSPSTSDILEVMPLYPRPQNNSSQVTNVYQVKDFKSREHNNNQGEQSTNNQHMYSNDFNRDLALLRNTLRQERKDMEDERNHLKQLKQKNENMNSNRTNAPLSPTLSNASEHYAQLSIEQQEAARHYMNLLPSDGNIADLNRNEVIPSTPLTPKQPEYCNFGPSTFIEMNSYANLALGENANNVKKILRCRSTDMQRFTDDTLASMSPVEELEVNYAVLDIDKNKESAKSVTRDAMSPENVFLSKNDVNSSSQNSTQPRGRQISQGSLEKVTTPPAAALGSIPGSVGYTTIDFDKTVALTSVAANAEDGSRKTRHNSVCGSPNSTDRIK